MLLPLILLTTRTLSDVTTGIPDAAPPGFEEWESPIILPAPPVAGTADWASAVQRARAFVAGLTLEEKVNVTTGVDIMGRCVGNTGVSSQMICLVRIFCIHLSILQTIPRIGWKGLCLEDSPLGVRLTDLVSAFPAGINAAATWDVDLIKCAASFYLWARLRAKFRHRARGTAMGQEHRGKGVNAALGPMTNMGTFSLQSFFVGSVFVRSRPSGGLRAQLGRLRG